MIVRLAALTGSGLLLGAGALMMAGASVLASLGGQAGGQSTALPGASPGLGGEPSALARAEIPPAYLRLYQAAAATCPGLSWSVLAGIGQAESDQGRDDRVSSAGALGPMQFEPATFAEYDQPIPPGGAQPPSPWDPTDAIYAAARDLCANGARDGADVAGAIYAYNHDESYVSEVLADAAGYTQDQLPQAPVGPQGEEAAAWALAQVGTPYQWGGETPGAGFDCSGLVQAAYASVGVALPRVAQAQFDAGPPETPGTGLDPGDLVFFGTGPGAVTHVGIYLGEAGGQTYMVDAPHTGATVRVEAFPATVGAAWGEDVYVGATRPG